MVNSELEVQALGELVGERRKALGVSVPAETRITPKVPPAMTDGERTERAQKYKELEDRKVLEERISRWKSLVVARGSRYENCRLENFSVTCDEQRRAVATLTEYCRDINARVKTGDSVVLFGPRGTGKDHLAMSVCREAVKNGFTVRWQNGMDLFGDIRDAMDDSEGLTERVLVERLVRPDVLYLSDPLPPIGMLTQFQATMIFRILDARYSRSRPIICTVNVSGGAELDERMGAQNGDRLRDGATAIFCNWQSYRKVKA